MTRVLVLLLLIAISGFAVLEYSAGLNADPWQKKFALETPTRMEALSQVPNWVPGWPPRVGKPFPNLTLYDHQGEPFKLETLRGKPVLVEVVAMSCAGCQAFSGGNVSGGFDGFAVQSDLQSIEEYLPQYSGGHSLFSDSLSFVQLVIYDLHLRAPKPSSLSAWRKHFGFDAHPNTYVVSGGEALANSVSFKMIPGFILLDSNLLVRFDATGHAPRHNLYTDLLPGLGALLAKQ